MSTSVRRFLEGNANVDSRNTLSKDWDERTVCFSSGRTCGVFNMLIFLLKKVWSTLPASPMLRWASTVKWKNSYDLTLHHKHHWQDKHLQLNGRILTILHYTTNITDNKISIYSWMEEFLRSYITPQASLTIRWASTAEWKNSYDLTLHHKHHWQ